MSSGALAQLAEQRVMTRLQAQSAGIDVDAELKVGRILNAPTLEGRLLVLSELGLRHLNLPHGSLASVDSLTELAYQRRATEAFSLKVLREARPTEPVRHQRLALVLRDGQEAYLMSKVHGNGYSRAWIQDVLTELYSTLLFEHRQLLVIQPRIRTLTVLAPRWSSVLTVLPLPSVQDGASPLPSPSAARSTS